jgi:hypothetical protein
MHNVKWKTYKYVNLGIWATLAGITPDILLYDRYLRQTNKEHIMEFSKLNRSWPGKIVFNSTVETH